MPKRGQKRQLPTDLRAVLSENLTELKSRTGLSDSQIRVSAGVSRSTIERAEDKGAAANIDTVQAIAKAFGVEPNYAWLLLMKGGAASILSKAFGPTVPDSRLGSNWRRPDRAPLLQSGNVKSSTGKTKIKSR